MTSGIARPASLAEFPFRAVDKLRYGDTDRLGHVNNARFATFYETGRVELLNNPARAVAPPGADFVVVHLGIDFMHEVLWPGEVSIGTAVVALGRSSCRLRQAIFHNDRCVSVSESVAVLMDAATRRATPIPEAARSILEAAMTAGEAG